MLPLLFSLLFMVIVLGLMYWLVSLLPLPDPFKTLVIVIVVLICVAYLFGLVFGVAPVFPVFRGYHYR